MAMNNPAYTQNKGFAQPGTLSASELQAMYDASPNAVAEAPMTVEGSLMKSIAMFAFLIVGAVAGWMIASANPSLGMTLMTVSLIVGFALAMVNIFKKQPSPALMLVYAIVEGFLVGVLSLVYNTAFDGIVLQAVIATFVVVGVTLALFASGKIRASARATKVFMIAMVGYILFSLMNMFLVMFGVIKNPYGVSGVEVAGIPLGVIIGVLVVIMAAYSLVLDFDFIKNGAANKLPRQYEWTGAFGVMVTVIWLYMEILRILAISRN